MSAATNSERVRASRLRAKAETEILSAKDARWLQSYTTRHPRKNPPQAPKQAPKPQPKAQPQPKPQPVPELPPAPPETETYVAPPAGELTPGFELPDLRDLDAQPTAQPPANAARTDVADVFEGATPDPVFGGHAPGECGVCSECKTEQKLHAPRCSRSGAVIPRPLSRREAMELAAMSLGAVAIAAAGLERVLLAHTPRAEVLADAASAWERLSERFDLTAAAEWGPYVSLLTSHTSEFYETKKAAQALKATQAAPANILGA